MQYGQYKQRQRESQVWERRVRGMGPVPVSSRWVSVGERGSDLFLFWHIYQELDSDFPIRVAQDWSVTGEEGDNAPAPALLHLKSRARQLSAQNIQVLSLPVCPDRPARDAVLDISFGGRRHAASRPQRLPSLGVEPLEWILLTRVPVFTLADAWERVCWSRCRWLVEAFYTILNSGGRLQSRRRHPIGALENLSAIRTPSGMRLPHVRPLVQGFPDLPAHQVASQQVLSVLALLDQRPHLSWTVRKVSCFSTNRRRSGSLTPGSSLLPCHVAQISPQGSHRRPMSPNSSHPLSSHP